MHELAPLIIDLAIILGLASITTLLFQKIKQPVVLGYLIAGTIAGPYAVPLIHLKNAESLKVLSELGVIFLMFSLGLEFSFHKLKRIGPSAGVTGVFEVILGLLLGYGMGSLMGWSFYDSLFLGAAISISSTTIIVKALNELKLQRKRFAELVVGILVVEDMLAVLLLVALTTIVATNNVFSMEILWAAGKLLLVVGSWFLIGYSLMPVIFNRIKYYVNEETLIVVAVALCLLMVCIAAHYHYSTALGAFIMGSILAETPLVHRIEHLVQPLRNVFAAVFFISIGMLIDPHMLITEFPTIAIICVGLIVGRIIIVCVGVLLTGQSVCNAVRIGSTMAQIGEFSFIIVGLGAALNVISNKLYPIIVAVSAITTFITPYCIKYFGVIAPKVEQHLPASVKYLLNSYTSWLYQLSAGKKGQSVYGKAAVRLVINSLITIVIFNLAQDWLLPWLNTKIAHIWVAKLIGWLITLALSSPFIWGMLVSFHPTKPDSSKQILRENPAPYLLSWLFTLVEVIILSLAFFESWPVALLLLVIATGAFIILNKQLDKFYHWFEQRLATNLQQSAAAHSSYENLAPWDSHLIEAEIPRQSPLIGKCLSEQQLRQRFGINIVAIYRGATAILSPRGNEVILPLDKLVLLGTDEQLEQFTQHYLQQEEEATPTHLLENFTLKAVTLDKENPLVGKTIAESGIREHVKGLVVGIERQGTQLLNPDSKTVLATGDLLFLVGENEHLAKI